VTLHLLFWVITLGCTGKIDGDVVRKMHFGGFSDDEGENEEGEGEQVLSYLPTVVPSLT
jgi:hypothetical protein